MGDRLKRIWSRQVDRSQAAADRRNAKRKAEADPNAISYQEAERLLGLSEVHSLVRRRILEPAVMVTGFDGITRESVERELERQENSSGWQRFCRRAGDVLDVIPFPF